MLKKIVIFGVGLIGGSFAAALRKAGVAEEIVGVGRTAASLTCAKELGLIDRISTSVEEALRDADLVLIAAPVAQTENILSAIKPWLQPQTVVTDAGSIKGEVAAAAARALGDKVAQFVPGHPIAGSEANGPNAAMPDLYVGKKVVLTPLPQNTLAHVERVATAWQHCGAVIHKLSVEEHDAVFAAVSHLPHLLAYALVDDIASRPHADLLFQYAASGFRDFTRIAGSSPEMWRDISLANQPAILKELDAYIAQLTRFRGLLVQKDGAAMEAMFANARRARNEWIQGGAQGVEAADAKSRQDREP